VSTAQIIDVSDATFESDVVAASRTRPVVVDFWAAWCGPCRALGPMLEDVVQRNPAVTLAKLDVDSNQQSALRFGIRGIPAVKAFRAGRVVSEFVGLQPRQAVERFIAALAPVPVEPLPDDEAGLRARLGRRPDDVEARRALGRKLMSSGRFQEADSLLAEAPGDAVCDGLRARIELLRSADQTLPPALNQRNAPDELRAMPDLIALIRTAAGEEKSRLRRVALGVLAAHNGHDPAVETLRGQLANAIF
jgi:putative thioredoxin